MIRIPPHHYIHVMDTNKSTTKLVIGPKMFSFQDHERVTEGPTKMINIPPRNYCIIKNPIVVDEAGKPVIDVHGEVKVSFGEHQVRVQNDLGMTKFVAYPDPFPLYPYEEVVMKEGRMFKKCVTLKDNEALKLVANRPFIDERFANVERFPEDTYQILGPSTYYPFVEETVVEKVQAFIITTDMVVVLEAIRNTKDENGQSRKAGERWLHTEIGSFIPSVDVHIVDYRSPKIITEKKCIHLKALRTYKDCYGHNRKAGEEWLVKLDVSERHILSPQEEFVGDVHITALSTTEYCFVVNPIRKDGTHRYGTKELRIGELQFFLNPGEYLETGFMQVHVLEENDCLLLKARCSFKETEEFAEVNKEEAKGKGKGKERLAGETWMIRGPCNFIPTINVDILEKRTALPLGDNEGVYVRNKSTGEVRLEKGKQTFILKPHEELWEKELSQDLELLIAYNKSGAQFIPATIKNGKRVYEYNMPANYHRVKTDVVKFKAPHNSAVQIFDFKTKTKKVIYGPEMVMLEPYEDLTVLKLSGSMPKEEDVIRNCALLLGPDFMTDLIEVETADHAKLELKLAYNWEFKVNKDDPEDCDKLFCIRDFVGDACKAMASRIRGVVSTVNFETFHKHSTEIITVKGGIFKKDENGVTKPFHFKSNNLFITSLDIQSIDPVDQETRLSLQKSVNLSFEIQTKSQEAQAKHQAARLEQESKGQLDRLRIQDEIVSTQATKKLLQLQAESESVKSTGVALAKAKAEAESAQIMGETEVSQAEMKVKADIIRQTAELDLLQNRYGQEVDIKRQISELKVSHEKKLADIEAEKFNRTISALGRETIKSMARAGPELQARLLKGLGLKGFVLMDGKNPINLFNAANGLLGNKQE
jgi:major vault protein